MRQVPKELRDREKDILNVCWALHRKVKSLSRETWTHNKIRALTTSARLYSFSSNSILRPEHHFALMGYPAVDLSQVSRKQAYDLVGEAMAMPNVTALAVSLAIALTEHHEVGVQQCMKSDASSSCHDFAVGV